MDKGRQGKQGQLYQLWLSFSIKQKLCAFAGAVIVAIGFAIVSNLVIMDYALYGFGTIMEDNVKSAALLDAVSDETAAFATYVRLRTEENRLAYEEACRQTGQCVMALPYDHGRTTPTRYARTWSIRNFYGNYSEERERFLLEDEQGQGYVEDLYRIYRLQGYMDSYARRLMQLTTQEGNDDYLGKQPALVRLPYLLVSGAAVLVCLILALTFLMWGSLVTPLALLAQLSRKIAKNEFPKEDIAIPNRDEMGELVAAFNKMKHATIGYIDALEEKYEITRLLHLEELERVEMEKNLEASQLEVLKSQTNPHFLFNTLNMISSMAKLEDAGVTERMIGSMSNLFRYNLKTAEAEVLLEQEVKVVDDYIYLQQMRFGSRVQCHKDVAPHTLEARIPSFSLQPLVENAILHGLSKKEQGGKLYIRAKFREQALLLTIADSGVGLDRQALFSLREAMGKKSTSRLGIGIGNISKRLQIMYKGAELRIYSKKGCGTIVQMKIPQTWRDSTAAWGGMGGEDVSLTDCG